MGAIEKVEDLFYVFFCFQFVYWVPMKIPDLEYITSDLPIHQCWEKMLKGACLEILGLHLFLPVTGVFD